MVVIIVVIITLIMMIMIKLNTSKKKIAIAGKIFAFVRYHLDSLHLCRVNTS